MVEFVTKTGAKVVTNLAPWEDAKRLKAAVEKEASASGLKIDAKTDASVFVNALLSVDGSESVDAALWPCLIRCTRNSEKITSQTFDTKEGRQDYYEIVKACMTENFGPLVEGLLSVLPAGLMKMMKQPENGQKSE